MIVIFTDLDGTLLDENYSFEDAEDVLEEIKRRSIPLIFCSAKTRAEQEYFQRLMGISDPFIVEDGSAIYVQKGYFK
ncbi:MAG: mannosyl-3-phosphoglycerate phosphatase, partial [Archaeoglobi archaeon]|nr:mannosyl-3-phosphoglycerate phosphatase [Archaeoglobi archaeon]